MAQMREESLNEIVKNVDFLRVVVPSPWKKEMSFDEKNLLGVVLRSTCNKSQALFA